MATDDFNRADTTGPDLGPNWTNAGGAFATNGFAIVSNAVAPPTLGTDKMEFYSGASFSSDQYSQAAITVTGTGADTGLGVTVRSLVDGSCYRAVVSKAASNNFSLGRYIAGAFTTLDHETSTWVDGDILRLEVRGNFLQMYQNGVAVGAGFTDSSLTGGAPGISYSSTVTSCSLDNWEGASFSGLQVPAEYPIRHFGAFG